MNVKVLKSPSSVGHISTNKRYLFYTARPSVVRYTPNARCVLQICCTVPVLSLDKHTCNGATQIASAFHDMPQTINQLVLGSDQAVAPDGITRCTAKTIKTVKLNPAEVTEKQGET
jgi:hypothetical protein